MGRLILEDKNLYIHLSADDIKELFVVQVEGGGRNYYACYDVIHGNRIPIPHETALDVIDMIKQGKICDINHSFFKDKELNF